MANIYFLLECLHCGNICQQLIALSGSKVYSLLFAVYLPNLKNSCLQDSKINLQIILNQRASKWFFVCSNIFIIFVRSHIFNNILPHIIIDNKSQYLTQK